MLFSKAWQGGSSHLNIPSQQDAMTGGIHTDLNTYFRVNFHFSNKHLSKHRGRFCL